MDIFEEVSALTTALDARGVAYALCGAVALAVHGFPRATKDIDLLVKELDLEAFRTVARARGFDIEALPMTFSASGITVRRFTKLVGGQALIVDALIATGPLEAVFAARERFPYEGGSLSVVSRAGLITLKLAAARPQDLVDIERLKEVSDGSDDG